MGVVDALLRVALVALTAFPGEESAQRVAAKMLLPALTRRRALCRACVSSQSWAAVADAARAALESFGNANANQNSIISFPPEIHRFVAEALCRAAEGVADERALEAYVAEHLGAMGVDEAIDAEAIAQALCMKTGDFRRAFEAFAAKRKPVFEGN